MINKGYRTSKLVLIYLMSMTFVNANDLYKENLSDNIIEISKELKCLVCDGQNIFESNSNFSKDIKMYIKKELNDGKKKEEIILDIHSKYGDSILMKPPVQLNTYLLWFLPSLMLLFGILYLIRKRTINN
jgi:cytochrome c-type biogenesis protein CcmH|tara:strand:+ start:629 stop:1018 length:390 start_codon:yes stop_codon:yes gene_type:complete